MTAFVASSSVHHSAARGVRCGVAVGVITLHAAGVIWLWQSESLPDKAVIEPLMVSFVAETARATAPAATAAHPVAPQKPTVPVSARERPMAPAEMASVPAPAPAGAGAVALTGLASQSQTVTAGPATQGQTGVAAPSAPVALTPPSFGAAYLNNPKPAYPMVSRRRGELGVTRLRVLVSAEGRSQLVEIERSSGSPRLDQAARSTVGDWRFVPAREGDKAVAGWVIVPINWNLEN